MKRSIQPFSEGTIVLSDKMNGLDCLHACSFLKTSLQLEQPESASEFFKRMPNKCQIAYNGVFHY